MMALALFASSFALVFALGLQSLNVNRGHFVAAFVTSFAIGASQLFALRVIPSPDTGALEMTCYLLGGPFGIVASMVAHPYLVGRRRRGRQ